MKDLIGAGRGETIEGMKCSLSTCQNSIAFRINNGNLYRLFRGFWNTDFTQGLVQFLHPLTHLGVFVASYVHRDF